MAEAYLQCKSCAKDRGAATYTMMSNTIVSDAMLV
jgi:hypothetical protein